MQKLCRLSFKDEFYRLLEIVMWEINKEHCIMKVSKEAVSDSKENYTKTIQQNPRVHL